MRKSYRRAGVKLGFLSFSPMMWAKELKSLGVSRVIFSNCSDMSTIVI